MILSQSQRLALLQQLRQSANDRVHTRAFMFTGRVGRYHSLAPMAAQQKGEVIVHDSFDGSSVDATLKWWNEPTWAVEEGRLRVEPPSSSDLWQRTHYTMIHDNAPFLYLTVPEEDLIQVQTRVSFQGIHQYDQAGLMVRRGAGSWIKTSVEFEDEHSPARLGSVVTNNGWSDWATQDVAGVQELSFRITKYNRDDICVQYNASPDECEDAWSQIRIARLLPVESVGDATYGKEEERNILRVGLYCCCPVESGYRPLFHYLDVRKLSKQDCPIACVDAF